jgi:hypothetical protein
MLLDTQEVLVMVDQAMYMIPEVVEGGTMEEVVERIPEVAEVQVTADLLAVMYRTQKVRVVGMDLSSFS